jgi:energy-coupling factor transport system substrate-specific component
MKKDWIGFITELVVFALGFLSLLAPFFLPQTRNPGVQGASAPVMVSLLIILCLFILLLESQRHQLDSKMVAVLGILVAVNAGLRFLENAIPGPAGFSPVFFLIILTGYFFGSRIGFLMGVLTMLVSALITGGVGPWLPGQMITAGWMGQSANLLKHPIAKMKASNTPLEIILLCIFGGFWGLLFGGIMNLWFWPFMVANPDQSWLQTASLRGNLQRYLTYYTATSLFWDISRSIGNILMMSILSRPVLRIFMRFEKRFNFHYHKGTT